MPDKPNPERPQRIELPNGYYLIAAKDHKASGSIEGGSFIALHAMNEAMCKEFAAAMAPQDGLREAWLDISSAPRDGTECLCCEKIWITIAGHEMGGHRYIAKYVSDDVYNGKWISSSGFVQPTHWMLLPVAALAASPAAQHEAMPPAGGQREEDLARQISETCLVVSKMTLDPEEHPRIRLDEWKTAFLIAQAIREAELRGIKAGLEAAAKININKVGREWVHDSLWDKLANQFAASIRALNPETILEGK